MVRYIRTGKTVDFTPPEFIAAGTVMMLGELMCIAKLDIPANTLGTLAIEGVFEFPKESGAGTQLGAGTKVYWNLAEGIATGNEVVGVYIGKAVATAGIDDTVVHVKLDQ